MNCLIVDECNSYSRINLAQGSQDSTCEGRALAFCAVLASEKRNHRDTVTDQVYYSVLRKR